MINTDQINDLIANGASVFDSAGDKIGSLGQIYLDDQTNQPSWLTVNTGLFGMSESFVPLDNADVRGDEIHVGFTKDQVKDAPKMDPDGHLDPAEEERLYAHYGQSDRSAAFVDRDRDLMNQDRDGKSELLGDDRSKRTTGVGTDRDDASMVRAEERLNVGTEEREAGKVRLRKHVVTENVTQTVPVSREEVRVERVPLGEGDADRVRDADLGDDEVSMTLRAERPVVSKESVPVEEVRLAKETVTGQETVSGQVRKEHIETEGADVTDRQGGRKGGDLMNDDHDGKSELLGEDRDKRI